MKFSELKPGMVVWNKGHHRRMTVKTVHKSSRWVGGGYATFGKGAKSKTHTCLKSCAKFLSKIK
jgi:hypothetical protein